VPPDHPTGSVVGIGDVGAFWFLDRTHGFGQIGWRLVRSDDAGRTWRVTGNQIPPDELNYLPGSTVFTSLSDGYLFGRGLRVTHDGGMTWTDPHLAPYVDYYEGRRDGEVLALQARGHSVWLLMRCADSYACADLFVSDDAGATWRKQSTAKINVATPVDLVRVGDTAGYAVGAAGLEHDTADFVAYHHVAVTRDGGRTWTYRDDPCRHTVLERLAGDAAGHLWLVCGGQGATAMEGKEVYRSDDGAGHWRLMASVLSGGTDVGLLPASGGVSRLVAVSGQRAYLGLSRSTQIQSIDGGRTWRPSFPAPAADGGGPINFVDPNHGWGIGDQSVYRTTDGVHWTRLGGTGP
jgi:photosystem II stability/assembly factor-like uncharacterized protein